MISGGGQPSSSSKLHGCLFSSHISSTRSIDSTSLVGLGGQNHCCLEQHSGKQKQYCSGSEVVIMSQIGTTASTSWSTSASLEASTCRNNKSTLWSGGPSSKVAILVFESLP